MSVCKVVMETVGERPAWLPGATCTWCAACSGAKRSRSRRFAGEQASRSLDSDR